VLFGEAYETNLLYNDEFCNAMKTKKYIVTREERYANNVHRMRLLKYLIYKKLKIINNINYLAELNN
jgi:hypothetical protein